MESMKTTTAKFVKTAGVFQGYYVITLPSGEQYIEHDLWKVVEAGIPEVI